jgi:hypothetical protein
MAKTELWKTCTSSFHQQHKGGLRAAFFVDLITDLI